MEKFENDNIKKESGDITRREFLKFLMVGGASVLCSGIEKAFSQDAPETVSRYEKHGWFYTLEEMQNIYEQEYQGEKLLQNIIRKKDNKWVGVYEGGEFEVPEEFLQKTLKNFKEMLEKKSAKFLFRLDAFHGHFFVQNDIYESRYKSLRGVEIITNFVKDSNLRVLFHNSEHLKVDKNNRESLELYSKRNCIGYYDGRHIKILPLPKGSRTGMDVPENNSEFSPYLKFAAHKDGQFSIIFDDKEIRLDISFDDMKYY